MFNEIPIFTIEIPEGRFQTFPDISLFAGEVYMKVASLSKWNTHKRSKPWHTVRAVSYSGKESLWFGSGNRHVGNVKYRRNGRTNDPRLHFVPLSQTTWHSICTSNFWYFVMLLRNDDILCLFVFVLLPHLTKQRQNYWDITKYVLGTCKLRNVNKKTRKKAKKKKTNTKNENKTVRKVTK